MSANLLRLLLAGLTLLLAGFADLDARLDLMLAP